MSSFIAPDNLTNPSAYAFAGPARAQTYIPRRAHSWHGETGRGVMTEFDRVFDYLNQNVRNAAQPTTEPGSDGGEIIVTGLITGRAIFNDSEDTVPYGALIGIDASRKMSLASASNTQLVRSGFSGSGLNDAVFGGTYTGTSPADFLVVIDATGAPDTMALYKNGVLIAAGTPITGAAQTVSDGVTIDFAATTGHTLGNAWTVHARKQAAAITALWVAPRHVATMTYFAPLLDSTQTVLVDPSVTPQRGDRAYLSTLDGYATNVAPNKPNSVQEIGVFIRGTDTFGVADIRLNERLEKRVAA